MATKCAKKKSQCAERTVGNQFGNARDDVSFRKTTELPELTSYILPVARRHSCGPLPGQRQSSILTLLQLPPPLLGRAAKTEDPASPGSYRMGINNPGGKARCLSPRAGMDFDQFFPPHPPSGPRDPPRRNCTSRWSGLEAVGRCHRRRRWLGRPQGCALGQTTGGGGAEEMETQVDVLAGWCWQPGAGSRPHFLPRSWGT